QKVSGKNIFELIDQLTLLLKKDLDIPAGHIEAVDDLAVAEMFTNSPEAARLFTMGLKAQVFERDLKKAKLHFREAVRLDPSFASGYNALFSLSLMGAPAEEFIALFQSVKKHIYKIPERERYYAKMGYYFAKNQGEKALSVLKMIMELYPEDVKPISILATFKGMQRKHDESIALYKKLLKIDPRRYEVFQAIGEQYQKMENYAEALKYYQQYAEHFPKDQKSFTSIAGMHLANRNFAEARTFFEKALIIEPESVPVLTDLATISIKLGEFDKALEQTRDALAFCQTPKDKAKVYETLTEIHKTKGQPKQALENTKLYLDQLENYLMPIQVTIRRTLSADDFVVTGKIKQGLAVLDKMKSRIVPAYGFIIDIVYLEIYMYLKKPAKVEEYLQVFKKKVDITQEQNYLVLDYKVRSYLHEAKEEYTEAIDLCRKGLALQPGRNSLLLRISRCARKSNQFDGIASSLQKYLKTDPFNPQFNFELSLVYSDMGDKENAAKYLKTALEIWKDAEPDYKPARLAREKAAL
ncbi:MAG: tetratricopeptide repeat protein, partial [bacterium]|nr:tetratricopeptide repeat protein [bacterium]